MRRPVPIKPHPQVPHVVYPRDGHAVDGGQHHRPRCVPQRAFRVIPAKNRLVHPAERPPSSDYPEYRTRRAERLKIQVIGSHFSRSSLPRGVDIL